MCEMIFLCGQGVFFNSLVKSVFFYRKYIFNLRKNTVVNTSLSMT